MKKNIKKGQKAERHGLVFSFHAGILHKGDGENVFVSQQPPLVSTVMGTGAVRPIACPSCSGPAAERKLFAPVALACGSDGSVYVGDFNFIRRILPNGFTLSILELRSVRIRALTRVFRALFPLASEQERHAGSVIRISV